MPCVSATGRASQGCRCPGPSHANLPCDDRPSDAALDLFCDTHLARPPESEKRDVLREESIDIAILSVATPGRFIRAFDGCEAIELKQSLRTGLQDLSSDALLLRCSDAEVSQDRAAVLTDRVPSPVARGSQDVI